MDFSDDLMSAVESALPADFGEPVSAPDSGPAKAPAAAEVGIVAAAGGAKAKMFLGLSVWSWVALIALIAAVAFVVYKGAAKRKKQKRDGK